MQSVLSHLQAAFASAIHASFDIDAEPLVTLAQNPTFGDYQSNAAMGLAKTIAEKTGQKTNPRAVAEQIKAKFNAGEMVLGSDVSIAGPGFINVKLNPAWINERLSQLIGGERLGIEPSGNPQTVVVDYSGPNVAKQMHVGHLRSTIIGDALSRVIEFQGNTVIRQNHIGDWGTQFGMLITYLQALGSAGDARIEDLDAFYKKARTQFDSDPLFADQARAAVVRLQGGDENALSLWRKIVAESRRHYQPILDALGVGLNQDNERGESFYNAMLPETVADLKAHGIAEESDGATVVFTEAADAPLIIEKTGGGYGYATTDLSAARFRADSLHAERIIYVVGAPQGLHFRQIFATARKAGWVPNVLLEHAAFGSVLGEDGKMFKARSGDAVKLIDVLDEAEQRALVIVKEKNPALDETRQRDIARQVGIGAVKYADLSKDRTSDYVFSWDKMLAMDGNTGPYLQYAYARIRSIFRKAGENQAAIRSLSLNDPFELTLAKHVLRLGETIDAVARELRPHLLCTYLYDLAAKFSSFYENCPVLASEEPIRSNRLRLCELTARTMALGLELLGIEHPEQM